MSRLQDAPILSVGRKMLSAGRKMLQLSDPTTLADPSTLNDDGNIHLTGNGISAGEGGNGVTTTLAGQAEGGLNDGQLTDVHVEASPLLMSDAVSELALCSARIASAAAAFCKRFLQEIPDNWTACFAFASPYHTDSLVSKGGMTFTR